ncbi:MAG: S-methyl-5-thioribose-1-phosphate isomerase, partial [Bacilli bacterium]
MTKTTETFTNKPFIRSVEWKDDHILLLDQQQLPHQTTYIPLTTIENVWNSIHSLKVRGAPAIGIAAAFGLALWAAQSTQPSTEQFQIELKAKRDYLASSRPTAVNLEWALDRLLNKVSNVREVKDVINILLQEALEIQKQDEVVCRKIGEYGLSLLNDGDTILTHCN